jgi:hypothetical protein
VTYTDSTGVPHVGTNWVPVEGETYTYTTTMMVPKATSFTKSVENLGGSKISDTAKDKGSKAKKAEKVQKSDIVERYKEVDDSLEKLADSAEDAAKAMDRLYGTSRLKQMEKQNDLIQDEIKLLK